VIATDATIMGALPRRGRRDAIPAAIMAGNENACFQYG
jgi:hypothetical protein